MSKIIDIHSRTTVEAPKNVVEDKIQTVSKAETKSFVPICLKKFIRRIQGNLFRNIIKPPLMGYRRYRTPALLGKLAKQCQKLNSRENFCVFLDLSGHCESISLTVHPMGWKAITEKEGRFAINILNGNLPGHGKHSKMRLKDLHLTQKTLTELERTFRILRENRYPMARYASFIQTN